jgi:hypothetical protein
MADAEIAFMAKNAAHVSSGMIVISTPTVTSMSAACKVRLGCSTDRTPFALAFEQRQPFIFGDTSLAF